jgi:hypothetical protein
MQLKREEANQYWKWLSQTFDATLKMKEKMRKKGVTLERVE